MKYATLGSLLSIVLLCAFGGVGLAQAPAPAPSQPTKTVRAVQNFATVTDQVIAAPKPKDWLVHRGMLATGIITIGFSFFFGTQNSSAQALMTAALSATIALVLFLIWALNHPFAGLVRVEPAAFQQLWNIIDQWSQQ